MFEFYSEKCYITAFGLLFIGCVQLGGANQVTSLTDGLLESSTSDTAMKTSSTLPSSKIPSAILIDVYTEWSKWSQCSKHCQQSRVRKCKENTNCGGSWLKEKRSCKSKGSCNKRSFRSFKLLGFRKNDKLMEDILYKLLYGPWTPWGQCSRSCKKRRIRKCSLPAICGVSYIQEERICRHTRSMCKKQYTLNTVVPLGEVINIDTDENVRKIKNITATVIGNSTILTGTGGSHGQLKSHFPLAVSCGIRPGKSRGNYRIVGGQEARKHSWPWQVAILEKRKEQFCGGTLIAPQWVLTAAHCVRKKKKKRKIFVRIGEHDIYRFDTGEEILKLAQEFPHPKYDFNKITNDIALLKLEKPVSTSTGKIGFACLPEEDDKLPEKSMCHILGWGKERNTYAFGSSVLQEVQVPLVNRRRCQKVFDYVIHDTQVCAGYKRGGHDSCAGDSGGPLLCPKNENGVNRWVVYGVTSYGEGCAEKGKFGIYTKVRKYIQWINDTITTN